MNLLPTKYFENAVSTEVVAELKRIYYAQEAYDTDVMKKASGDTPEIYELLKTIPQIDIDRIQVSNFYNHATPYLPHTDFRNGVRESFVIPLQTMNGPNPSLVIFDQWWPLESNTWVFSTKATFEFNKELLGRPCDYDIQDNTNTSISDELYEQLNYFPKKYWKGLSGKAYELKPGNLIEFDTKMIHATGVMECDRKLGLTIRYR
jgi:hypothetical protein